MKLGSNTWLQLVFIFVLLVTLGQATWWILDSMYYTSGVKDRITSLQQADAAAANRLLALGENPESVTSLFPHLAFDSANSSATVSSQALEALVSERHHRINRMGWEGTFFLVVLIAAMVVITRTIRQDSRLRRRQRNFIAAVSHELKSPIASLQLAAETLSIRDHNPEGSRRLSERMLTDLSRLNSLVTNILDASRIEQGGDSRSVANVTLANEVSAAVTEAARHAGPRDVDIVEKSRTQASIMADPLAVRTVLRNVLDNAVNATAATGGGRIEIDAADGGGWVELTVTDDGIGFPPGDAERLFERFYRPGSEMQRELPGTGLGLHIVRSLLKLDGGTVSARSDGAGAGATFTLRWPTVTAETM